MSYAGAKITGDKALLAKLKDLPDKVARKVNRRAVNLATTPILRAAKSSVPVEHGDLKKSLVKKISNHGMNTSGIVGADASYIGEDGEVPAKIDHLVEFGHATPDGGTVQPHPFLRPAWDSSIGTAQAKYETELANGIEKEATK